MFRSLARLPLGLTLFLSLFAATSPPPIMAAPDPVPQILDWTTDPATGLVHFQLRWENQSPQLPSNPVSGRMSSQQFGVFQPNFRRMGSFNVPPLPPNSFFDVFFDISLGDLPPSAKEMLPSGGSPTSPTALKPESGPPCPPDYHWDGNVDVVWTGGGAPAQVNAHYGRMFVCPGAGPSYIHIPAMICGSALGVTWSVVDLCPGFSGTVVNEDFSPAPAVLPVGWTGWICVDAFGVPLGTVCCPRVLFNCGGVPAEVKLCATACDWASQPPDPVPHVLDWTNPTAGTVRFQVRWENLSPDRPSTPVSGMMSSQPFGVFQPNFGSIGSFNVPPIPPNSFFDVFFDISTGDLPPSAQEMLPSGAPRVSPPGLKPETNPPCPPDDHWDGNVDVIWTGSAGGPGQVNVHYGTLLVCPGGGASYIHIPLLACGAAGGVTWSVADLCPGFVASLVNEDFTPAPAALPAGWSGWICVVANASVPIGSVCCPRVLFDCGGVPAEVRLCTTACDWAPGAPDPVPHVLDWTNPNPGTVRFQVRWENLDPQVASHPVSGTMSSQQFGVFQPDFGPIGSFNVPPIAPSSFFDVFFDMPLGNLPPIPLERLPGGGPSASPGLTAESDPPCPPNDHWDGNVDVVWTGAGAPGQVNVHYGTLLVCPGAGASYIHIPAMICGFALGVTWSVVDLCPGFSGTVVNEDFSPAPAALPPAGWTGWICVTADSTVAIGSVCCPRVLFDCGGVPAEVKLCTTACDWGTSGAPPGEITPGFALRVIPNPAFGSTNLNYVVPRAGEARVEIFNAAGRLVRTLMVGSVPSGPGSIAWNGRGDHGESLPAGLYVVRMNLGGQSAAQKILLVK